MIADAPDRVNEALRRCRAVTKREARNFYYGLKLAPEPKRSALFALYAWMRRVDDLVDEPDAGGDEGGRRARLEAFRTRTDAALRGEPGDDHLFLALAHAARRFPLRPQEFHDMIEGQIIDLSLDGFETFDELREYCRKVASTVGRLCIAIWGFRDDRAVQLAEDRGIAFQLTNILRDFSEDYERGRVYLPAADFRRHSVTPQEVRIWAEPARCRRFTEQQIERARSYFDRSAELDEMVEADCRPVLWAMTTIYRELLDRIAAAPRRAMRGSRVRLNVLRKSLIALEARRLARRAADARA